MLFLLLVVVRTAHGGGASALLSACGGVVAYGMPVRCRVSTLFVAAYGLPDRLRVHTDHAYRLAATPQSNHKDLVGSLTDAAGAGMSSLLVARFCSSRRRRFERRASRRDVAGLRFNPFYPPASAGSHHRTVAFFRIASL